MPYEISGPEDPRKPVLVDTPTASHITGIAPDVLRDWRQRAKSHRGAPFKKLNNGHVRYDLDALVSWACRKYPERAEAIGRRAEAVR